MGGCDPRVLLPLTFLQRKQIEKWRNEPEDMEPSERAAHV